MARKSDMSPGRKPGVLQAPLAYRAPAGEEAALARADLVFTGVRHAEDSFQTRVFLNNPDADDTTPATPEAGYAGSFTVFGHGGCFGDVGHCDIPTGPRRRHDRRPPHPLTPVTKTVVVTDALRRVLAQSPDGLTSVSLVPIAKAPRRADCGLTDRLLRFDAMELRTYA